MQQQPITKLDCVLPAPKPEDGYVVDLRPAHAENVPISARPAAHN